MSPWPQKETKFYNHYYFELYRQISLHHAVPLFQEWTWTTSFCIHVQSFTCGKSRVLTCQNLFTSHAHSVPSQWHCNHMWMKTSHPFYIFSHPCTANITDLYNWFSSIGWFYNLSISRDPIRIYRFQIYLV